ncbi:MAG: hypothetical protein Ta2B_10720 [Termitinemataceae bacterium]|nr:MAG: hypothetical protein Ta2B_10720 [Termitinemataceae bacterium]
MLCEDLRNTVTMPEISVIYANPILKDGAAHGIVLAYRIGDGEQVYQCVCLFSSAGDGVERR